MASKLKPHNSNFFVNPYNFISLNPQGVLKNNEESEKLTGYISCTLKVGNDSMLALPDRNAEDGETARCFDFFKVNSMPVIPGSEIRGCIRSVFEAVTRSCLSVLDNEELTTRMSKPRTMSCGLLEYTDNCWVIYPAEYRSDFGAKKGRYPEWKNGRQADYSGRMWRTTNSPKPEGNFNFYKKLSEPAIKCSNETVAKLIKILEIYIDNNKKLSETKNGNKKDCEDFEKVLVRHIRELERKEGTMAVFYEQSGDKFTWFSPAAIGRYIYDDKVFDVLGRTTSDEENSYIPCSHLSKKKKNNAASAVRDWLCPACSLFGTLGDENSTASRVRFSDATAINVELCEEYLELPELSSPKLSTVEFYTLNDGRDGFENVSLWDYDMASTKIRGRKFYFHSKPRCKAVDGGKVGERQLATKPAKGNSTFAFKVYFDKISENELNQLLWVLTLGENNPEGNQLHKLGAGRPVGFGSVKITVNENGIVKRNLAPGSYSISRESYTEKPYSDIMLDKKAADQLLVITNTKLFVGDNVKVTVSYPIADSKTKSDDHDAGYQWFMNNRTKKGFYQILPVLPDKSDNARNALQMKPMYPESFYGGSQGFQNYDRPQTGGNTPGRKSAFDFSKVIPNKTYSVKIESISKNAKGQEFACFNIYGSQASVPLWNNAVGDTIRVVFIGPSINNPAKPFFKRK